MHTAKTKHTHTHSVSLPQLMPLIVSRSCHKKEPKEIQAEIKHFASLPPLAGGAARLIDGHCKQIFIEKNSFISCSSLLAFTLPPCRFIFFLLSVNQSLYTHWSLTPSVLLRCVLPPTPPFHLSSSYQGGKVFL